MYGVEDEDDSPGNSHGSSDYPESNISSCDNDGFLSWDRSRQSSAYRDNHADQLQQQHDSHREAQQLEQKPKAVGQPQPQRWHAAQQQQQQPQYKYHTQTSTSPEGSDREEKGMQGPTPFRPMAPREFALGNTLRRSHPAMPIPALPADATTARKGSSHGGSHASKSSPESDTKSFATTPSVEQGEIEMLQKFVQKQQIMQNQQSQEENQQQQNQQDQQHHYRRHNTNDSSMQPISEDSRSSRESSSVIEPTVQSAGQHAGGEGFQQAAGEAASENTSEQASSNNVSPQQQQQTSQINEREEDLNAAGQLLNEAVQTLSGELADAAAEAVVAAVVKSAERERNQTLGFLAEQSTNELLVFEGDPMGSYRNIGGNGSDDDGSNENNNNFNTAKEGESQDGSIQIHSESSSSYSSGSYSSHSSDTGGYDKNDDENDDEDDVSYTIGKEEGMHSRQSLEDSDLSETDSEEMDDEVVVTSNQRDSVHSNRSNESLDEQYIGHYLQSQKDVAMQDDMPTHLPLKRPFEHNAIANINVRDSMVSDLSDFSRSDNFPLTSQTIAVADSADPQEASGVITARFGKLLQECRDLTETCGDVSVASSSFVESRLETATKDSSSKDFSSVTSGNKNDLSSSQIKTAAAFAATNSTSLQTRQYTNPVTQKHEIDTSETAHLKMSQLTVDPALNSSTMSSDYRGSVMSMNEYRELKASTLAQQKQIEAPQEEDHVEEEEFDTSKDGSTEVYRVPVDSPFGRHEKSEQPMTHKSAKSVVSELSLGVDIMYGDTDEDKSYAKSLNPPEDLTAPFDPSQFMSELEGFSFGRKSSHTSTISDPDSSHEKMAQALSPLSNAEKVNEAPFDEAPAKKMNEQAATANPDSKPKPTSKEISPACAKSYISNASYMSSEFTPDEGGLLVGFGQRNTKRSITSRSSVSSSTSSGGFSSGNDDSSSDDSSSSGTSSSSSSSSSGDDSDSSTDSLDNIARDGLHIPSSRDSVSELSFGGASALMAIQASRAQQLHIANTTLEEGDSMEDDPLSASTPASPSDSKLSSNESGQQITDSSSRTGRRNSLIGEVDQLEKLEEVSESTTSDFLDDVSSVDDNNYAVQKFFSNPTNEYDYTSNMSDFLSSAASLDLAEQKSPAHRSLEGSFSSSSTSNKSPPLHQSQRTSASGDESKLLREAKSISMASYSQNPANTQEDLFSKKGESAAMPSNVTEAVVADKKRKSPLLQQKDSISPSSSGSKPKSFSSRTSLDSRESAASSGSYYKGVIARAAVMNQQDDDNDVDIAQLQSYSQNLENLVETTPSLHSSFSHSLEKSLRSSHSDTQKSNGSNEVSKVASEEFDDLSSMSSVVSKARTSSKRGSLASKKTAELEDAAPQQSPEPKEDPGKEKQPRNLDKLSMKSGDSFAFDGDELYEDFPRRDDDSEAIRRNRSSASQAVTTTIETDARRPWKTAEKEELADIADETVLSAHTGSQRGSLANFEQHKPAPVTKEPFEYNSDDDSSSDGSLSELFESKQALKRMGIYDSVVVPDALGGLEQQEDDVLSGSSIQESPLSAAESPSSSQNERDKRVDSITESIRSGIQSIKDQFFGETRSNYSKSVSSRQSNGSVKGLNDDGQQPHLPSAPTSDDSEGSLSLPKSDDIIRPTLDVSARSASSARMLADTAKEMSARLHQSLSSRSLTAFRPADEANEEDTAKELHARKESPVSAASEEKIIGENEVFRNQPKDDYSQRSSKAQDEQSISLDSLDDIEATLKLSKKKDKPPSTKVHNVSFDLSGCDDEEIGLPPQSYGDLDADDTNNNKATPAGDGAKTSWWKVNATKPHLIWGSVAIFLLIVLFSVIGAVVSNRNRNINSPVPTSQPINAPQPHWVQFGGNLNGVSPGDEAGFSVAASENGDTVIVGARRNGNADDNTANRGAAQIFRFDVFTGFYKQVWVYYGEAKGDQCGFSVSMSKDGRTVAIGCPGSDRYGINSGKVRIFMEDGLSKSWVMMSEFFGEGTGDLFGASVSLSQNGKQLAVGAPYYTRNDVKRSGSAYVFTEVTESVWQPVGNPMRGVVEQSLFGWSVSLSPGGTFLAVGAPMSSDGTLEGGFVRIFTENQGNDWTPYDDPITKGVPGDRFGFSVSMAGDKTLQRVAIGAPGSSDNGDESGMASVYEHSGNGWSIAGDDLLGESDGENLGYAVSLTPDANRLVIGVPKKQRDYKTVGQVQVYNVETEALTPAGGKYGLDGEKFGVSVAISKNGKRFFGGATEANVVRVYEDIPIGESRRFSLDLLQCQFRSLTFFVPYFCFRPHSKFQ